MGWQALAIAQLTAAFIGQIPRERGQTLAEYSLIMTVIAIAVTVSALVVFRTRIAGIFDSATNCLLGAC